MRIGCRARRSDPPPPGHGSVAERPRRSPRSWRMVAASELGAVLGGPWAADQTSAWRTTGGQAARYQAPRSGTAREPGEGEMTAGHGGAGRRRAAAAEALVLGQAGSLTPAGLRSAIARDVHRCPPHTAIGSGREKAEPDARVRSPWATESWRTPRGRPRTAAAPGADRGRSLSWARQLKKAGLPGSMGKLRARAYLDLLLGTDLRPRPADPGGGGSGSPDPSGPGTPPGTGAVPADSPGRSP